MGNETLQDSSKVYVAATWIDRNALKAVVQELEMLFDDKCDAASSRAKRGEFEVASKTMIEAVGIIVAINHLKAKVTL